MLELGKEAFDPPSLLVGDFVVTVLVLAMTAWRDDRLSTLIEDDIVKAVSVIGAVGKDLAASQSRDQSAGGRHVVLLAGADLKTDRQSERIDYGMELGAETATGATESLGLRSPLFRRAPAA